MYISCRIRLPTYIGLNLDNWRAPTIGWLQILTIKKFWIFEIISTLRTGIMLQALEQGIPILRKPVKSHQYSVNEYPPLRIYIIQSLHSDSFWLKLTFTALTWIDIINLSCACTILVNIRDETYIWLLLISSRQSIRVTTMVHSKPNTWVITACHSQCAKILYKW